MRADSRQKVRNPLLLQNELVGAGVERCILIQLPFHRGENQYRSSYPRGSEPTYKFQPAPGSRTSLSFRSQIELQENRVEWRISQSTQSLLLSASQIHPKPEAPKGPRKSSANLGFIVNQKY